MSFLIKILFRNDSENVAKIVLYDERNRVLMLKRSPSSKKYPMEWDLPGGHVKVGEKLMRGLVREVKEETSIKLKNAKFYKKKENIYFFHSKYRKSNIVLSHEHTKYRFFKENELDSEEKFQKIALEVLKRAKK